MNPSLAVVSVVKQAMDDGRDLRDRVTVELQALREWALAQRLPRSFVDKLPQLRWGTHAQIRTLMDELAELGYPYTANDLRKIWDPDSRK